MRSSSNSSRANAAPASRQPAEAPAEPPARRLLAELAAGEAVSGSRLAAALGVSRAAVWKQVEALRALGLRVAAQAGAGYRLEHPLELLDAGRILAALDAPLRERLGVDVHWQIDSTSSELLRRASAGADLQACLAESQRRGRGRRGRAWQMPLGGGLAFSLLRRFDGGMARLAGLSLAAGIAAVRALEDCGVAGVGLKWPNDLVADGRKLAGILAELGGEALGPCFAVVGIGVNVRLEADAGAAIGQPWIDLATLAGAAAPSRNRLAARLIARLAETLDRFESEGFAAFVEVYQGYDVLRERPVRVLRGDAETFGIARGVDARGALRVAFADGERAVDSAEVSIRARA